MNPCFFGPSSRRLFGIYQEPQGSDRRVLAVLCYPGPEEWMRTHWAYRQLAALLSRGGLHVFRFDYAGTGDSSGESGSCGPLDWIEDIGAAIKEATAIAGVSRVTLVGARLGGALALMHAAARVGSTSVQDVVLWDPVVNGKAYLAELTALHDQVLAQSRQAIARAVRRAEPELLGWPQPQTTTVMYDAIDLLRSPPSDIRVRLVTSRTTAEYTALASHLQAKHAQFRHVVQPDAGGWSEHLILEQAVLPAVLLRKLADQVVADIT